MAEVEAIRTPPLPIAPEVMGYTITLSPEEAQKLVMLLGLVSAGEGIYELWGKLRAVGLRYEVHANKFEGNIKLKGT